MTRSDRMTRSRIACRAVFLDAGGVIVLPDRHLLAGALARVGIEIDPNAVPLAHYRALPAFDRAGASNPRRAHGQSPRDDRVAPARRVRGRHRH